MRTEPNSLLPYFALGTERPTSRGDTAAGRDGLASMENNNRNGALSRQQAHYPVISGSENLVPPNWPLYADLGGRSGEMTTTTAFGAAAIRTGHDQGFTGGFGPTALGEHHPASGTMKGDEKVMGGDERHRYTGTEI